MSFIGDYHPSQVEFYATLGHAINQWAGVERGLYEMFWHLQGEPTSMACPAAYHAIVNFKSKLAMVDRAMAARYLRHPDQIAKWVTIKNRLNRQANIRNDFAHLQLIIDARTSAYEHKLRTHLFDPNPALKGDLKEYTVSQIAEYAARFNATRRELDDLSEYLRAAKLPEFDELEADHPSPRIPDGYTVEIQQPPPLP